MTYSFADSEGQWATHPKTLVNLVLNHFHCECVYCYTWSYTVILCLSLKSVTDSDSDWLTELGTEWVSDSVRLSDCDSDRNQTAWLTWWADMVKHSPLTDWATYWFLLVSMLLTAKLKGFDPILYVRNILQRCTVGCFHFSFGCRRMPLCSICNLLGSVAARRKPEVQ